MKHITDCFSKELVKICQKSYAADKWQSAVTDYLGEPINRHVQVGSFEKGKKPGVNLIQRATLKTFTLSPETSLKVLA